MDWDAVRVFLAVARTGRLKTASRQLGVEHTTVSRRLVALEEDIGAPLFHRTAAGYLRTPVAESVLPIAESMERAAAAIEARAKEHTGKLAGRVRVALAPEFASHWLVGHLPSFRATHPEIDLQILVGTRQRDLSRGEADVAVQSPRPRQTGLVAARIARAATYLYGSKTLLGGRRRRIGDRASLEDLPLLTYPAQFTLLQSAPWFQSILKTARVLLETNSTHALLAAARDSLGVAVLPQFVARRHDDLLLVSEAVANTEVFLVTHPEFRRDPKIRAMADFLKRAAVGPEGLS